MFTAWKLAKTQRILYLIVKTMFRKIDSHGLSPWSYLSSPRQTWHDKSDLSLRGYNSNASPTARSRGPRSLEIDWLLVFILAVATFFRFYKFEVFQYWSGDEELMTATIRHIIWDKSPTPLVQNANLGFGLGPFYHFLLVPFYFVLDFNLVALQSIASLLGIITTFLVYKIGYELQGRRLGLIASFLYSSSFLIALYDRRLWHLTLDSSLMALAALLLVRLMKGKVMWSFLLAIPIGFAFHHDASLVVIIIGVLILWLIKRFNLGRNNMVLAITILGIFFLPLFVADIRFSGSFHKPIIQSITRPLRSEGITSHNFRFFKFTDLTEILSKVLAVSPNNFIEQEFCYCDTPKPFLGISGTLIVISVLVFNFYILFMKNKFYNKSLVVVWVMMISLLVGIFIFNYIFRGNFYQHYFVIALPIFAILFGVFLNEVTGRNTILLFAVLTIFFLVNLYSLKNSSVKYPLVSKISLVRKSIEAMSSDKFSLRSSGDPYIQGGGWTELYTIEGHPAVKSYWYENWDWIYAAYSLYPVRIEKEEPNKIVLIRKSGENLLDGGKVLSSQTYKDLELVVIYNSDPKKL